MNREMEDEWEGMREGAKSIAEGRKKENLLKVKMKGVRREEGKDEEKG